MKFWCCQGIRDIIQPGTSNQKVFQQKLYIRKVKSKCPSLYFTAFAAGCQITCLLCYCYYLQEKKKLLTNYCQNERVEKESDDFNSCVALLRSTNSICCKLLLESGDQFRFASAYGVWIVQLLEEYRVRLERIMLHYIAYTNDNSTEQ